MSQLKPGMGCTLDGAAPDNKAVQRGSGGRGNEEEGCSREKERPREGERDRERERETETSGVGDGKRWTIERRPLGSELSLPWGMGRGPWSLDSAYIRN